MKYYFFQGWMTVDFFLDGQSTKKYKKINKKNAPDTGAVKLKRVHQ